MKTRSILTRGGASLAAMAMVAGLTAAPSLASAQTYGSDTAPAYDSGYRYDACRRERTNRGTGGALVGAGLGALAGGNVAARGNRTEGAVLGGILGAIVGANVGTSSAACQPGTYTQGYAPAPRDGYYGYGSGQDGYQQGAYDDGRYDDDDFDDGYARPVADGPTADGCTLAESPIYLPDGRVQKRFVRVCRDASGHYQVVD